MIVTPLTRPSRARLLRSYAGRLDAHPDAVFAVLVDYLVARNDGVRVAVDTAERFAVTHSRLSQRAEYRVLMDDEAGSRIEHELFAIPTPTSWLSLFSRRAVIADSANEFRTVLESLEP
ncbi:MAG: hypothetical protein ACOH1T_01060 [Microbacteriaceae bacterium]